MEKTMIKVWEHNFRRHTHTHKIFCISICNIPKPPVGSKATKINKENKFSGTLLEATENKHNINKNSKYY